MVNKYISHTWGTNIHIQTYVHIDNMEIYLPVEAP